MNGDQKFSYDRWFMKFSKHKLNSLNPVFMKDIFHDGL